MKDAACEDAFYNYSTSRDNNRDFFMTSGKIMIYKPAITDAALMDCPVSYYVFYIVK